MSDSQIRYSDSHKERNGVSTHRRLDNLLNRLFRPTSTNIYQSPASVAFVRWPMDSPHIGPVKRKMRPFDDVITAGHLLP